LVNGDNLPVVGEHHGLKHRRGDFLHSVHVAMTKQDIVIEWGIDNLIVNKDSFSPEFNEDILEDPFGRGWSFVISSQSDGRWYELGGAKFLPYGFGHDACGDTFINDAMMNCDVLDFNQYLESYQSRETGFPTINIKGDELCVSRVDYPKGRK
jgi:hypothetical protein